MTLHDQLKPVMHRLPMLRCGLSEPAPIIGTGECWSHSATYLFGEPLAQWLPIAMFGAAAIAETTLQRIVDEDPVREVRKASSGGFYAWKRNWRVAAKTVTTYPTRLAALIAAVKEMER